MVAWVVINRQHLPRAARGPSQPRKSRPIRALPLAARLFNNPTFKPANDPQFPPASIPILELTPPSSHRKSPPSFHALTWNPFCNPFVFIFMHVMGGVHESVWQLQVVATNCARPTTLSQYVVVATNKNRVPTQTRVPAHLTLPLATAILCHYPLPAAHYPPFFPGNFPSSPLVPISKNRPLGRPGGFQSCPTVTGVSSPKPLSSPPPFSSFRRPAHSRNLPPLRQAPLNQRHPSPRTVGCTSASSVPTPKAKPSASVTSISAPSSKPSAPRRTASSSPCRATIAMFASPS